MAQNQNDMADGARGVLNPWVELTVTLDLGGSVGMGFPLDSTGQDALRGAFPSIVDGGDSGDVAAFCALLARLAAESAETERREREQIARLLDTIPELLGDFPDE